jgi:hypothetical protein
LPFRIDGKQLYIKHAWVKDNIIRDTKHGFKTIEAKIKAYKNQETQETKYGIEVIKVL